MHKRPSSATAYIRTLDTQNDEYVNEQQQHINDSSPFLSIQPDTDPMGSNGMFVDNSVSVTIATGGCQNNVQVLTSEGLGGQCYVADYITKGTGTRLQDSLPMILEAVNTAAKYPSVSPDASSNPLRPCIRVLQSILNNRASSREYTITIATSCNRGLQQFSSSHSFRYVFGWFALDYLKKFNSELFQLELESNTETLEDIQNHIEEEAECAGELVFDLGIYIFFYFNNNNLFIYIKSIILI
jgi:hypothetical protein